MQQRNTAERQQTMRLALVIFKYFEYGGVQKDLAALGAACRKLAQQQHMPLHISLVCMQNQNSQRPDWCDEIRVLPPASLTFSNHARAREFEHKVQALQAQKQFDLVFGFNRMGFLDGYFAGDDCLKAQELRRSPWRRRLLPRVRTFLQLEQHVFDLPEHGGAKTIFVITEAQKKAYLQNYPQLDARRLELLPPNLEPRFFEFARLAAQRSSKRQELGIAPDTLLILQVAADFHTKGVDRTLEILSRAKREKYLTHFCFFAPGGTSLAMRDKFLQQALRLGLARDEVRFPGPRNDIAELLAAGDLMIHPARAEATGGVLVEALAASLPVLTTRLCGYSSYLEQAQSAILLEEPFQSDAYAAAFRSLLGNRRQKLLELRKNAANYAQSHITPEHFSRSQIAARRLLLDDLQRNS